MNLKNEKEIDNALKLIENIRASSDNSYFFCNVSLSELRLIERALSNARSSTSLGLTPRGCGETYPVIETRRLKDMAYFIHNGAGRHWHYHLSASFLSPGCSYPCLGKVDGTDSYIIVSPDAGRIAVLPECCFAN